ncbi:uncharacterized protein LOC144360395 [Saccoglossus kowalevskii]
MTDIAGIKGYHTEHSGKVTQANTLFRQNFDGQLIAERTGHSSLAIRSYKATSRRKRCRTHCSHPNRKLRKKRKRMTYPPPQQTRTNLIPLSSPPILPKCP